MAISLEAIVTGMNGGPEAIQQNFNKVKTELERMNGNVVEIPKEQFTPVNGYAIDRNSCCFRIYKFNSFAIFTARCPLTGVTMSAWKASLAVSLPKSYFSGFSKFDYLKMTGQVTGDGLSFDANFDLANAGISVYSSKNDINNKTLGLEIVGLLYN